MYIVVVGGGKVGYYLAKELLEADPGASGVRQAEREHHHRNGAPDETPAVATDKQGR